MMIYAENKGDLFLVDKSYTLAHCISKDCNMGAGIALQFNRKFPDMKLYCLSQQPQVGKAILYKNDIASVFNLITKPFYWNKPTHDTLRKSLEDMRKQCLKLSIDKIAMPRIGSGLDRLSWQRVKANIFDIFKDTDIEIKVKWI